MDCRTCKEHSEPISRYAFESSMASHEKTIKRLWIIILVLIILLAATNGAWIWYESQFEYVETWQEVSQTADGNSDIRFIGGDYYGSIAESSDANSEESP